MRLLARLYLRQQYLCGMPTEFCLGADYPELPMLVRLLLVPGILHYLPGEHWMERKFMRLPFGVLPNCQRMRSLSDLNHLERFSLCLSRGAELYQRSLHQLRSKLPMEWQYLCL